MRKTMTKIFALVLVCAMIIGFVAMIPAQAAELDTVQVMAHNVYFDDYLQIMYAVYVPEGKTVEKIVLSDDVNEFAAVPYVEDDAQVTVSVGGKSCLAYVADTGVTLQNIDTVVTAEIYVGGAVAATDEYSVLEYLHKQLTVEDRSAEQDVMYQSLLDAAEAMQAVLDDKVVTLYSTSYVKVINGTVDGLKSEGMVAVGATLENVTCDLFPDANQEVVWTVTEYTKGVPGIPAQKTPEQVSAMVVEKGVNLVLSAELTEADAPTTKEIVFEMGADGDAEHSDGNSDTATYSETVDGYTLSLTGGTKMYPSARDAMGNGAMKFGTSSVAGTFTTTVPNDVTKVIFYVAGYKANAAKVQINGGDVQSISTLSNNGEYTAIEVDTTTNKTITFTTVSGGYRAMLNTVKFVVMECDHNDTTEVAAKAATCTEVGYEEGTVFCNDCQCYISGGEIAATGHQNTVNQNVVAPTCIAVGTHDVFCNDCETTIQTGVETPATGVHTYVDGVCTGCGESEGTAVEPTTVTMDIFGTTGVLASGNGSISWTSGGVTFTNVKGSTAIRTTDSNHYRVYANSTVKIAATGMSQVTITCVSGYVDEFEAALTAAGYSYTTSGLTITITLSGVDEISFKPTAQARLSQISVTYQG